MSTPTDNNSNSTPTPSSTTNNPTGGNGGAPNAPGNGRGRPGRGGRNNNNNNSSITSSNPRDWTGNTPDIGGVLGLPSDVLDKKQSHQQFKKSVEKYILRDNEDFGRFLIAPLVFR